MVQITEILEKYRLSDVKAIAANGGTILHLVVEDENFTALETIEILKTLLDNGLDLRSKNQKEETVLHLAIKNRAKDIIDFLLERKVSLDNSAAMCLIENEYNKLLKLKNPSWSCDDEMQTKESESASFLEWMIAKGLDIDRPNRYNGRSALFLAIDYSLRHLLTVLLKYTRNIDYVGYETRRTLLHMVLEDEANTRWSPSYSRRYASSIVKILLDRGVSPESVDKSLNTALHLAIANYEDFNVVQMLIDHTTYLNHENNAGETPLSMAIRGGLDWKNRNIANEYRKICQSLMMKGDAVDDSAELELQPFHIFANVCNSFGREEDELFQKLISVGCNVNAQDLHGQTPLHIAVACCNVEVIQKLIENGAHIDSKNGEGATPLHLAFCNQAGLEIAKVLIKHGANVNAKDDKGFTPLHKETLSGTSGFYSHYCDRMKLLLEHGADFSALSDEGYSVLHIGVRKFDRLYALEQHYNDPIRLKLEQVSTSNFFNGPGRLTSELKFLLNHWVKLYAAKLECGMGYPFKTRHIRSGLRYYPGSRKIYEDCMKEIKLLKNTFISNYRTSIYAFLHMNVNSRRAHVHNEELDKLVHSPAQLEKQFPLYAILIISSYNETIRRKSLMEPAKIAWIKLTDINLGDLCIEHIFSFLSNAELYDFIGASGDLYSK